MFSQIPIFPQGRIYTDKDSSIRLGDNARNCTTGNGPMLVRIRNAGKNSRAWIGKDGAFYCLDPGEQDNFGTDSYYFFAGHLDLRFETVDLRPATGSPLPPLTANDIKHSLHVLTFKP